MSVKTLMMAPALPTNTNLPDPNAIHRLPDDADEIAWNRAFDIIFERKKEEIFDNAFDKWWDAYSEIIFNRAWDSVDSDRCGSEREFEQLLDRAVSRETDSEMESSFEAFYDLATRNTVTAKLIDREIKKIKKAAQ